MLKRSLFIVLTAAVAHAQQAQVIPQPKMPVKGLFAFLEGAGYLYDDFSRPDAQGAQSAAYGDSSIGSAQTGQPWAVSGSGYTDAAIRDHRLVNLGNNTVYLFAKSTAPSFRMAAVFSLDPTLGTDDGGPTIAVTPDPVYGGILDLLHFVILQSGNWTLMTRQNGTFSPVTQGLLAAPLLPYVSYSMAMTVLGTNVYLELPDGTYAITSTPLAPALVGTQVYWEIVNTASSYRTRYEQVSLVPLPEGAPPPSLTFTQLSTSSAPVGSSIYCPDCQEGTKPCAAGGAGTLAIRVNTTAPVWKCQ